PRSTLFPSATLFRSGPGGRRAARDEPWRSAGQCGLAALPPLQAAGDGIFGLTVSQREGAAVVAKGEGCGPEAEVIGVEREGLPGNAACEEGGMRSARGRQRQRAERLPQFGL